MHDCNRHKFVTTLTTLTTHRTHRTKQTKQIKIEQLERAMNTDDTDDTDVEDVEDKDQEDQECLDAIRYQAELTETIGDCIAVGLSYAEEGPLKQALHEVKNAVPKLRLIQTGLGHEVCELKGIALGRLDELQDEIETKAYSNRADLARTIEENLSGQDTETGASQVDGRHRELAEKNNSLQQTNIDLEERLQNAQHELGDVRGELDALLTKYLELKASVALRERKKKAKTSSDHATFVVTQTQRANAFCSRLNAKMKKDINLENLIVCGKAPLIPGVVMILIESGKSGVPLHCTLEKLCKVLNSNQSLAMLVAENDSDRAKARRINFTSTSTLGSIATEAERNVANPNIGTNDRSASTEDALIEELTDLLVKTEPSFKKLQDAAKFVELKEKVVIKLREYLNYRTKVESFLSVVSKGCAVDHLLRNVIMEQVLTEPEIMEAWALHSKFSVKRLEFNAFAKITVSDFRVVLRNALVDVSAKKTAITLTIKISTSLRERRNTSILPAWADSQNVRPHTGEIAIPTEVSGLFVDNTDTYTKSSQQTKQQCMAVRVAWLPLLDPIIRPILEANNIDMKGFDSLDEILWYQSSRQLGGPDVGIFEILDTYAGWFADGPDLDFTLPENVVKRIQSAVDKASKNKLTLNEFMAFLNLAGSREHREATAEVYVDLLEHFRTSDGEE